MRIRTYTRAVVRIIYISAPRENTLRATLRNRQARVCRAKQTDATCTIRDGETREKSFGCRAIFRDDDASLPSFTCACRAIEGRGSTSSRSRVSVSSRVFFAMQKRITSQLKIRKTMLISLFFRNLSLDRSIPPLPSPHSSQNSAVLASNAHSRCILGMRS